VLNHTTIDRQKCTSVYRLISKYVFVIQKGQKNCGINYR